MYTVHDGKVGAEGGGANIDVVEVVGDNLAPGAVAIVVVERVVARIQVAFITGPVVQSVVAAATHEGGGLKLRTVATEAADKQVAANRIGNAAEAIVHAGSPVEIAAIGILGGGEIGRASGAEHHQLVERVDKHAVGHITLSTAKIGGKQPFRACGVELENANVGRTVIGRIIRHVVCAERYRVFGTENEAGGVGVLLRIVCRRGTPVVGYRARVGGKHQYGVDNQFILSIVLPHLDVHLPFAALHFLHFPPRLDLHFAAVDILIDIGLGFNDVAYRRADSEITLTGHPYPVGTLVAKYNLSGVGLRSHDKVVFHSAFGGIHFEVYAVVEAIILHGGKRAHVRAPPLRIVAYIIIIVARLLSDSRWNCGLGTVEVHLVGVAPLRAIVQVSVMLWTVDEHESQTVLFHKHGTVVQLHFIADLGIPLPEVFDKHSHRPHPASVGVSVSVGGADIHQCTDYQKQAFHLPLKSFANVRK